ncbi:intermembrane lipid transfer protein Vps13D-like [Musca vetustissima]|uniref:intermembrane lipid transfer protein Vps13D-like n=1 Tax=Musca vetustissima TaxID=27455 RepID=UPI002AB5F297|nr:intermembrane lipid transfer protein Vps13D-like [Musca vetustissima]
MLNELITWVLNTYLGKYLEDFNPAQLSIALISGEVELENVPIRRDALRSFGIPVEALSGSIGRIKLQIPVRQFRTSPWSIVIERVYGVFVPKDLSEWDNDKEKDAEYAYKIRVLDAKEANWRVDNGCNAESYYSLSYSNWINYGTSLATNILENLELTIKDVHLRYEDTLSLKNSHRAAGIRINTISAQSCDSSWIPGAKNPDTQNVSFKILELKDLHFYWDVLDSSNMCRDLSSKELLEKMNQTCKMEDHNFLTNPINATLKFKRERCKQPLRNKNRPRISCDVFFHQVNLSLNDVQYTEIVGCFHELQNISHKREYKILRPSISVLNEPKRWWKYAAECYGYTLCSSEEKLKIAGENIKYMLIYKRLLINPSENLTKEEKQLKINIEKNRSLDTLKLLRDVCCNYLCDRGVNTRHRNIAHGKNILYNWFPNWLGWYGVSDNTISDAPIVNNDAYKHIEDDILSAIKESIENDTFSKRDAIFGNFTFALSDVNIALKAAKSSGESVMFDMELKNLFCFIEIKPKLTSYRVGISLGSVHLNDKYTPSTEFPFLIKPQHQETTNTKSFYNEFLSLFSKREVSHSSEEPWFQLQYERSPPEHRSDYRLIIKSKSLDVVYNENALKWIVSFFVQPITDLRNVRNIMTKKEDREASRLKFFKNWKNVLVGQKDNRKKWSFEIDISAPRIMCVENFQDKNTSIVLIDFGRFQLFKNERSPTDVQNADVDVSEKDSDEELFMTPCSTPPGSKTSLSDTPNFNTTATNEQFSRFVINNDTGLESELHSEIYDKYIVNLTDLQILVCKNRECGFACAKSSSSYHLLDKFNINLHLERRIIITSDPEYPSFTLFGNLNRIVAHINEQKISDCLKILNPITFDIFNPMEYSSSDETNMDNDSDALHNANTTIFKFVIGQIILEIQSREKSIAEIQIIGAKAGVTRKSDAVNISMSVHGFLLVDAIQSFGPDFELLIASHRHVEMDSISGSIKQSEPCSPISPGSPDPSGHQRCASPHIINRALNELQTGKKRLNSDFNVDNALITVDINIIHASEGQDTMQIANITFNNLDVIANQETIVELLGFAKRILDNYRLYRNVSTRYERSNDTMMQYTNPRSIGKCMSEVSFDFHRLNILVLRSTRLDSLNIGRKVGTLTMSEAKIHATIGNEICVSGALGGIQVVDITPEGYNHQRIFSVGKDPLTDPPSIYTNDVLFTLTNEMYGTDFDDDCTYLNALSFKISQSETSQIVAKIRMASVWYTHCPRFIEEIYLCVKEFKQYFKNFVRSIRTKASHMAKGLVNHISSNSVEKKINKFGEISLDIILSTPVLVLPRSCKSHEVLVANLGRFTVCNKQENLAQHLCTSSTPEHSEKITYFIDVRNINLFSLNTQKRKNVGANTLPKANEIYSCHEDAVPILHDTALLFQCVYESKLSLPRNCMENSLLGEYE